MTTTSLADAKTRLSEIIASAVETHERTVITRNGRPAAVLISVDDWESIEETMFWLPHLNQIRTAQAEPSESWTKEQILEMIHHRGEAE